MLCDLPESHGQFCDPGGFMSNALRWLPQLRAGDLVRAPFANVPIAAIDPADIAAVAATALGSDGHTSRAYELSGPAALLPAEQVGILASALGRKLRFEALPDTSAREELRKSFSPDFAEAVFRFFAKGEFDDSRIVPTVYEITGRQPGTFEQWIKSHIDAFR